MSVLLKLILSINWWWYDHKEYSRFYITLYCFHTWNSLDILLYFYLRFFFLCILKFFYAIFFLNDFLWNKNSKATKSRTNGIVAWESIVVRLIDGKIENWPIHIYLVLRFSHNSLQRDKNDTDWCKNCFVFNASSRLFYKPQKMENLNPITFKRCFIFLKKKLFKTTFLNI